LFTSRYDVLNPFLNEAIPQKIQNTIPYLMARSLPITLTKRLTRSLTHALVPTLSRSLSSTSKQSHQRYWCDLCYRKALHCNYCHDSRGFICFCTGTYITITRQRLMNFSTSSYTYGRRCWC
jgi:hypothetical protein